MGERATYPEAVERLRYSLAHVYWRYVRHGAQYRRDALAMQALAPLAGMYLPWTYFSMRPSGVVAILNDIAVKQRTGIVECGGGVSTLFIGRLLRERGGRLYTVEESAEWAETLRGLIAKEELAQHVTVLHAPIADVRIGNATYPWYSDDVVRELTGERDIDLLIVDGPVAEQRPHIRYPALPYFYEALTPGATVVIDDIDRRPEQQIVRRWELELGVAFERRFLNGIAVAEIAPR